MDPARPEAAADLQLIPIGHIETPYRRLEDCPRNIDPAGPVCRLQLRPEFADGLLGLEPGREILVLYWLQGERGRLRQTSRRTGVYSGVFALRTPHRPNPVGAGRVRIEAMDETTVTVRGLDCLDGTLLLDIKPAMGATPPAGPEKEERP